MKTKKSRTVLEVPQAIELAGALTQCVTKELHPDLVQKWIGKKRHLQHLVGRLLRGEFAELARNPFWQEWKDPGASYPSRWEMPSIAYQQMRLGNAIKGFEPSFYSPDSAIVVPECSDGIALVPAIASLAELWGIKDCYGAGYGQVLEGVLNSFGRDDLNYWYMRKGLENCFRINASVKEKLISIEAEAMHRGFNCLAMPISFGRFYAGYSPRNARTDALLRGDLPLGSVQNSCLLLVMPERLTDYRYLFIDCSGDDYDRGGDGEWDRVPLFRYESDKRPYGKTFDCQYIGNANYHSGSTVAFLGYSEE